MRSCPKRMGRLAFAVAMSAAIWGGAPALAMAEGSKSAEPHVASAAHPAAPADATAGAKIDPAPWSFNVQAGVGTGMVLFHPTRYTRSSLATFIPSLALSASYHLAEKVSLTGAWGANFELTRPNNPSGRRFFWGDPSVSLSHGSLWKDDALTGINVSGAAALSAGLSLASLTATQLFALNVSLTASRTFLEGRLGTSLTLTGGLPFHRYTNGVVRTTTRDGVYRCLTRPGGNEVIGSSHCATGNLNALATFGLNASLSYQATEHLGLSLSFGLMRTLAYGIPVDAFSSKVVDSKGRPVVDGTHASDAMMGSLGLSYALPNSTNLSASLSTGGAPFAYYDPSLTDENRVLRFPFWDPRLVRTVFTLSVGRSF